MRKIVYLIICWQCQVINKKKISIFFKNLLRKCSKDRMILRNSNQWFVEDLVAFWHWWPKTLSRFFNIMPRYIRSNMVNQIDSKSNCSRSFTITRLMIHSQLRIKLFWKSFRIFRRIKHLSKASFKFNEVSYNIK